MRATDGQEHRGPQHEQATADQHRSRDTDCRPPDHATPAAGCGLRPPQTKRAAQIDPLPCHEQNQWQAHRSGLLHRNRQREVSGRDALRVPQASQADGQRREPLRDGGATAAARPRPEIASDVGPPEENLFVGEQVRRDLQHEPDDDGRRDERHGQRQGQPFDEAGGRDPVREPGGP